jgi:uncharacterized protein
MKTALIIFAKLPRPGEVKTRLGNVVGMEEAASIYRVFAQHAFSLGEHLTAEGVEVYVFYDPLASEHDFRQWVGHRCSLVPQEGDSLGERMRHAFERTFRDGSSCSVIIGTDVPDLTADTVVRAFEFLATHDAVIGPSTDGGYYLLGMNAPSKDLFSGIAWSTASVFDQTLSRMDALALTYATVDELHDIDTVEDYRSYQRRKNIT